MKKIFLTLCAAAIVLTAGSAFAAPQMQFLGSIGVGYYGNTSLDTDIDDTDEFLKDALNYYGMNGTVKKEKSSTGYGFNAEFRYFFDECLGAGLSIGYNNVYSGSVKSDYTDGFSKYHYSYEYDLTAVPVMANFYYRKIFGENFLLLGAGLGFVHGMMDYKEDDATVLDLNLTKNAFGCQLMAEYDWIYESGFTLFAGLKGRYGTFKNMKDGDWKLLTKAQFTGAEIYFGAGYSM